MFIIDFEETPGGVFFFVYKYGKINYYYETLFLKGAFMEILYRPYYYQDLSNALGKPFSAKNEIVEENTVHIMMYFDFKDIQGCIKEGIITPDLHVCYNYAWEQMIGEDLGYKVELINNRLIDLDEKDHELRGQKIITPFCIDYLNCFPNRNTATELSIDPAWEFGQELKKLEFRIVVPYRLGEIEKRFNHEEVTLNDYKDESFELQYPVITNVKNSKYSKKLIDTRVDQVKQMVKANKTKRYSKNDFIDEL